MESKKTKTMDTKTYYNDFKKKSKGIRQDKYLAYIAYYLWKNNEKR